MDYSKLNAKEINVLYMMLMQIDEPIRSSEDFRQDIFFDEFCDIFQEFLAMNDNDRCQVFSDLEREVNLRLYISSLVQSDSSELKDALLRVADDLLKMPTKDIKSVASGGVSQLQKISLDDKKVDTTVDTTVDEER